MDAVELGMAGLGMVESVAEPVASALGIAADGRRIHLGGDSTNVFR